VCNYDSFFGADDPAGVSLTCSKSVTFVFCAYSSNCSERYFGGGLSQGIDHLVTTSDKMIKFQVHIPRHIQRRQYSSRYVHPCSRNDILRRGLSRQACTNRYIAIDKNYDFMSILSVVYDYELLTSGDNNYNEFF